MAFRTRQSKKSNSFQPALRVEGLESRCMLTVVLLDYLAPAAGGGSSSPGFTPDPPASIGLDVLAGPSGGGVGIGTVTYSSGDTVGPDDVFGPAAVSASLTLLNQNATPIDVDASTPSDAGVASATIGIATINPAATEIVAADDSSVAADSGPPAITAGSARMMLVARPDDSATTDVATDCNTTTTDDVQASIEESADGECKTDPSGDPNAPVFRTDIYATDVQATDNETTETPGPMPNKPIIYSLNGGSGETTDTDSTAASALQRSNDATDTESTDTTNVEKDPPVIYYMNGNTNNGGQTTPTSTNGNSQTPSPALTRAVKILNGKQGKFRHVRKAQAHDAAIASLLPTAPSASKAKKVKVVEPKPGKVKKAELDQTAANAMKEQLDAIANSMKVQQAAAAKLNAQLAKKTKR